jgi:hypothetical protein
MKRTPLRLLVACLAVIVAAVAVAGGSAGNRIADPTFEAIPAPGSVTYGENIAYQSVLDNTNNAVFTHVEFRQRRPVATFLEVKYPATFVTSSCGALDTKGDTDPLNDEVVCDFGELRPEDAPEELVVVWTAPSIPSDTGCAKCLTSDAIWLIKEGKQTNGNESFPRFSEVELLGDQPTKESLRASGYELPAATTCALGSPSLRTNQTLTKDNPVSSAFCLPSFVGDGVHLGLAAKITELKGNARQSEVCIAQLGGSCGAGYVPKDFGPDVVTFEFRVFNPGLKGGPIREVSHNGVVLTPQTCATSNECLVSLTYDQATQIWTIIATSETNGPWNW